MKFFLTMLFLSASMVSASEVSKPKETVWAIDSNKSIASFKIKNFSIFTVKGKFTGLSGKVTTTGNSILMAKIAAKVPIKRLSTGISKRDKHLLEPEFFNGQKFPYMLFESTKISKEKNYVLEGKLTIKGVTKLVSVEINEIDLAAKDSAERQFVHILAHTEIDRQDFGVSGGTISGGSFFVGNKVKIALDVQLVEVSAISK